MGASSDGPAQAKVGLFEEEESASTSTSSPDKEEKKKSARLSSLSTEEWRAKYESDGCVDLWVEEEFNAGSRLVGGRAAHLLGPQAAGAGSGEGRVLERAVPVATHTVKIFNKATAQSVEVAVPEDRYVLWVSFFFFFCVWGSGGGGGAGENSSEKREKKRKEKKAHSFLLSIFLLSRFFTQKPPPPTGG